MIGHILVLKWFVIEIFKTQRIKKKFFSLTSGNTKDSHRKFIDRLMKQGSQIEEVDTSEESDFIIFFCPVVSRAGTDIEAALRKLNDVADTKPAIVVVLHYTFDPECIVPESHRVVNRDNTLTVDCLFHEDQGLLRCKKNEDSLNQVANKIKSLLKTKDLFEEQSDDTTCFISTDSDIFDEDLAKRVKDTSSASKVKDAPYYTTSTALSAKQSKDTTCFTTSLEHFKHQFFSLTSGNTLDSHWNFIDHLMKKGLQIKKVDTSEESDFIMFFCPVVSRAGTDIEAALRKLNDLTDTKPAILVVLHYTFNPECIVPESHRVVNREKTYTVDCLFHEDQGLLRCQKNEDSLNQVVNKIKSWIKPKASKVKDTAYSTTSSDPFDKQPEDTTMSSENTEHRYIGNNYLILLADNRMTSHKTLMDYLTKQIPNIHEAEEFNFILVFCPVVSRAGTDIQAALHKLNEISGTISAILVVFHYTFNTECIVPESHRVVNRDNTFTVDCLFHEDQGLLKCKKNEDSLNQVVNKIKSWIKPEDLFDGQPEDTPFFMSSDQDDDQSTYSDNSTASSDLDQDDDQSMDSGYSTSSDLDKDDDQSMDSGYSSSSDDESTSGDKASTTLSGPKIVTEQSAGENEGTKSSAESQGPKIVTEQSAGENEGTKSSAESLGPKIVTEQSAGENEGTKSSAESLENQQNTEKSKENDNSTTTGLCQPQNDENYEDITWESIAEKWYDRSYWVF